MCCPSSALIWKFPSRSVTVAAVDSSSFTVAPISASPSAADVTCPLTTLASTAEPPNKPDAGNSIAAAMAILLKIDLPMILVLDKV